MERVSDGTPTHPPVTDPLIGTVLCERYRIEGRLGEGGMGIVYRARHIVLEKTVALKVLHPEYTHRQELVERFLHEAKAAARIRNEHVVDIYDFGQTATGSVFFAMELLEGTDLASEIARRKWLPFSRALDITLQLCGALHAAHEAGVIHRDLKPANVFLITRLGRHDYVKILDFGIAKLVELEEPGKRLTRTGMIFGTPEYMSPEQARGERPDRRVDVYATACILWEMLFGRTPYTGDTYMGVLTKHLLDPIPLEQTQCRPDVPPGLISVLEKALAKNRDERFGSMAELAAALLEVGGDALDASAVTPTPALEAPAERAAPDTIVEVERPRGRGRLWLGLALGAAVAAVGAYAAIRRGLQAPAAPAASPPPSPVSPMPSESPTRGRATATTAAASAPTAAASAPTAVTSAPTAVTPAPTAVTPAPTAVTPAPTAVTPAPTAPLSTTVPAAHSRPADGAAVEPPPPASPSAAEPVHETKATFDKKRRRRPPRPERVSPEAPAERQDSSRDESPSRSEIPPQAETPPKKPPSDLKDPFAP